jgi:hypothetical protein
LTPSLVEPGSLRFKIDLFDVDGTGKACVIALILGVPGGSGVDGERG